MAKIRGYSFFYVIAVFFVGTFFIGNLAFGQADSDIESDVMLEISHAESGAVTFVKLNGEVVFDASKHRRLTLFDKNPGLNHKSVFLYGEKVYSQTWDKDGPVGVPYIVLASHLDLNLVLLQIGGPLF